MRNRFLIAAIATALLAQSAVAAPANMNSGWISNQSTQQPKKQGFWSRIMRGKQDAAPQPAGVTAMGNLRPEPTRSERFWGGLKNNPVTSMVSGGTKRAPESKPDSLSLQTPTGALTPKTHLVMSRVAEAGGDLAKARESLRQALALDPKNIETLRAIGHLEDRHNRLDVAEQMYRRAAAISPRDSAVLNDLAICCARQGKMQESAVMLGQAVTLSPSKPLYRNNIAKVLVELGQPAEAFKHLATTHPKEVAHYNLGALLGSKGDAVGASRCFQQALAINPGLKPARAALAQLAPKSSTLQVAAAPQETATDPAPATEPVTPIEPAQEEPAQRSSAPLLLPPVEN